MLTEHEQPADHEARISRQELMQKLPPLQQPLDNIEEIRQALSHEWQPFETAPDGVDLLWYATSEEFFLLSDKRYLVSVHTNYCHKFKWQHLPPPPKEQK